MRLPRRGARDSRAGAGRHGGRAERGPAPLARAHDERREPESA